MSERITEQVPLLSIRDLTVAFRTQEGLREVLHGVSFDVCLLYTSDAADE